MKQTPTSKPKQLRGDALKARIVETVHELVSELGNHGNPSHISMKAIAARVPCSRTTLLRYDSFVARILEDVDLRLARRTGDVRAKALEDRVELLRQEAAALKAELNALRAHHVNLYGRLLMSSTPVASLARDDAITISQRDGRCLLCGGPPTTDESNNIVDFPKPQYATTSNEKK